MCIGLYTSRIVLQTLGVVDFGIYSVVGGLVAMFDFINGSMQSGSLRYITFAIGRNECCDVRKAFTASVFIHWGVAFLIILLAETVGLWFFWHKMVIPEARVSAAFWVYQCSIVSACIMIVSVPYNVMIIAQEKMSAFAYFSIVEVLLKLLIVYALYLVAFDKLIVYGILTVFVQLFIRQCYALYCKKHFSHQIRILFPLDRELVKEMVQFSSWSLNGSLALVASTQGINLLLNMFFGPVVNAARGIAVQVQSKVVSFCNNFQMAVNPQITKSYAQLDFSKMHRLIVISSKLSFFLMLILSLPVIVCISPILHLWLGVVPDDTEEFVVIMLFCSLIRVMANPLFASISATGDIKRFQLWEGTTLLMVLPLAYMALRFFRVSPVVVILIYLAIEIIAQCIRIAIILPRIGMSVRYYLSEICLRLLAVTFLAALIPLLMKTLFAASGNFLELLVYIPVSAISALMASWVVGCNSDEKRLIREYLVKFTDRVGIRKL